MSHFATVEPRNYIQDAPVLSYARIVFSKPKPWSYQKITYQRFPFFAYSLPYWTNSLKKGSRIFLLAEEIWESEAQNDK